MNNPLLNFKEKFISEYEYPEDLVDDLLKYSKKYEGFYDLLAIWNEEKDEDTKYSILIDILNLYFDILVLEGK